MTFKMHEIRELIRLIDESSIDELELEKDGEKVAIRKTKTEVIAQQVTAPAPFVPQVASQAVAPTPAADATPTVSTPAEESTDSNLHKIVSPMVGTFYRASSPDADPYVKEGDTVQNNTVVCIVEAMKLMNELEAEVSGTIEKVLVENGQLVEFGQPLFLVKPS